jgi:hypothetical protein
MRARRTKITSLAVVQVEKSDSHHGILSWSYVCLHGYIQPDPVAGCICIDTLPSRLVPYPSMTPPQRPIIQRS